MGKIYVVVAVIALLSLNMVNTSANKTKCRVKTINSFLIVHWQMTHAEETTGDCTNAEIMFNYALDLSSTLGNFSSFPTIFEPVLLNDLAKAITICPRRLKANLTELHEVAGYLVIFIEYVKANASGIIKDATSEKISAVDKLIDVLVQNHFTCNIFADLDDIYNIIDGAYSVAYEYNTNITLRVEKLTKELNEAIEPIRSRATILIDEIHHWEHKANKTVIVARKKMIYELAKSIATTVAHLDGSIDEMLKKFGADIENHAQEANGSLKESVTSLADLRTSVHSKSQDVENNKSYNL